MARHVSTGTPATLALARAGVPFAAHEYEHDPMDRHFGEETVERLGVEPARTFKTLVAEVTGGADRLVCAVVPVSGHLDLKALAQAAGAKRAAMAAPEDAERVTGYVVGGISPLGQKRRLPMFVDASARAQATILVSGGRRGLSLELAPDDLVGLLGAHYAEIGRA